MLDPAPAPLDWTDRLALVGLRARGFRSRTLPSGLGPLHLVEAEGGGTLPPILLLHGLGSCASDYLPLLMHLLPLHRRVLALDLPGHGASAPAPVNLSGRELATAVFRALDVLPAEPMLVFGCSLGGLFAVRLAVARPERIRALMLASPAGAPMSPQDLDRLMASFALQDHAGALAFVDRFMARPGPSRHVLAWGVRRRFTRDPLLAVLRRVGTDDLLAPEELAAIDAPVTLFWGRHDRVLPPEHVEFFRAHLRSVRVEEGEGYGHAPFLDQPRAFASKLEAFARGA